MKKLKTDKPGVIVLGGHTQGLGIIRTFANYNIPGMLVDETKINIAKHSKYCYHFQKIKFDNSLPNSLINLLDKYNFHNWLIIPTSDKLVKIISQAKNDLKKYFKISVDNWDIIEKCYNKKLTYSIAEKTGVPIPKTFYPKSIEDLININIDFPCIIKPAVMHNFYAVTKSKVIKCKNFDELINGYNIACSIISKNEIMIQEIIEGDGTNQFSVCFLFDKEKPIVSLVANRLRQFPMDFGKATTFAKATHNKELYQLAVKLLSEIQYWGICEVEFKYDFKSKQYKLLEINPRTWKWHTIALKSDSPFLFSLYNYLYNGNYLFNNQWKEAEWMDWITDKWVKLRYKIKSKNNKNILIYSDFDKTDIQPFIWQFIYSPILAIKR